MPFYLFSIYFLSVPHLVLCIFASVLSVIHLFPSIHHHVLYILTAILPILVPHILTTVLPVPFVLHPVLHILTVILFVPYLVMCALVAILSVPYVNNLSCIFCLFRTLFRVYYSCH